MLGVTGLNKVQYKNTERRVSTREELSDIVDKKAYVACGRKTLESKRCGW